MQSQYFVRYNLTDNEEGNVSRRGKRHWDWLSRQRCFNAQSIAINAPWYSKSLEMSWHSAEKGPLDDRTRYVFCPLPNAFPWPGGGRSCGASALQSRPKPRSIDAFEIRPRAKQRCLGGGVGMQE